MEEVSTVWRNLLSWLQLEFSSSYNFTREFLFKSWIGIWSLELEKCISDCWSEEKEGLAMRILSCSFRMTGYLFWSCVANWIEVELFLASGPGAWGIWETEIIFYSVRLSSSSRTYDDDFTWSVRCLPEKILISNGATLLPEAAPFLSGLALNAPLLWD